MSTATDVIAPVTAAVGGAGLGSTLVAAKGLTAAGMVGSGAGVGAAAGPVGAGVGALVGVTAYTTYRAGNSLLDWWSKPTKKQRKKAAKNKKLRKKVRKEVKELRRLIEETEALRAAAAEGAEQQVTHQ